MNVMSAQLRAPDPSDPPLRRVALLVDGENLDASNADAILTRAANLGDLLIRRVYGKLDDIQNKGWSRTSGFRLIPATSSKNSADLLLSIDAMELALDGWADCIVIAASDNDYTHVALKLRERGFPVYGLLAEGSKCADLRAAYWGVFALPAGPVNSPPATSSPLIPEFDRKVLEAIKHMQRSGETVTLPKLGTELRARGLSIKSLAASWSKHFRAHPQLYKVTVAGSEITVAPAR